MPRLPITVDVDPREGVELRTADLEAMALLVARISTAEDGDPVAYSLVSAEWEAGPPVIRFGTCYGRQEHIWSDPINSAFWGCLVKRCARCDRISRA